MWDFDITSLDGAVLAFVLGSIGILAILFGGLTVIIGALIVLILALAIRYAWIRFDRWAKGLSGGGGVQ